MKVFLMAK